MAHVQMSAEMRECVDACSECHRICLETVQHCLERGGRHAEAAHIRTLLDCAQVCATSADLMLRGSDLHAAICTACAEVCERCAEDCERFSDDPLVRACADACRRCAESCRQMAGRGGHARAA
jgi:hypothetical protein